MKPEPTPDVEPKAADDAKSSADARRYRVLVRFARLALVVALAVGMIVVYRGLPPDESPGRGSAGGGGAVKTTLRVVLRTPGESPASSPAARRISEQAVELYSIDTSAAAREYLSERRAGIRFDDFLRELTPKRPRVAGNFDASGEAVLSAAPGRWWVHARRTAGDVEWTWRVPVNLVGREQIIELTPENAYTRVRSY